MAKGSGGAGGRKNSGGVGGRSGSSPASKIGKAMLGIGAYYAMWAGGTYGAMYAMDPSFRGRVNEATRAAVSNFADKVGVTPITAAMRDKVRAWAAARASAAAGNIDTEGVAVQAARAALEGRTSPDWTGATKGWKSIPDSSVIGFAQNKPAFRGKDVKGLIRDGIAAAKAGRSQVANPGPGKYESAARRIDLGAVKGRPPRRKKT